MLVYDNKLSFGKADVFFLLHRNRETAYCYVCVVCVQVS